MLKVLNPNKDYIFDKETALANDEHLKANYESGNATYWVNYCNGKRVIDIDVTGGFIWDEKGIDSYCIEPKWCKEIFEEYFKVKAKEKIIDQFDNAIVITDDEYNLIHEDDETYTIIDELGENIRLGKEHFYYVSEE